MKTWEWSSKILAIGFAVVLLAGCAETGPYAPGPYTSVQTPPPAPNPAPPENGGNILTVGPQDHFYVMHVENNTPFEAHRLPLADRTLYEKGYDRVRRDREADFAVDVSLTTAARDNPDVRAEHLFGGAILGAATGALIGAAAGRPALGAAVGAAGGGALGLAAPAATPMVRIDVRTQSFRDGTVSARSALVDMVNVPPYDVPRVIDTQVSRMLQTLPTR